MNSSNENTSKRPSSLLKLKDYAESAHGTIFLAKFIKGHNLLQKPRQEKTKTVNRKTVNKPVDANNLWTNTSLFSRQSSGSHHLDSSKAHQVYSMIPNISSSKRLEGYYTSLKLTQILGLQKVKVFQQPKRSLFEKKYANKNVEDKNAKLESKVDEEGYIPLKNLVLRKLTSGTVAPQEIKPRFEDRVYGFTRVKTGESIEPVYQRTSFTVIREKNLEETESKQLNEQPLIGFSDISNKKLSRPGTNEMMKSRYSDNLKENKVQREALELKMKKKQQANKQRLRKIKAVGDKIRESFRIKI